MERSSNGSGRFWPPQPLRFFPDYHADPVWDQSGAMLSVDYLPISVELRRDLRAWGRAWTDAAFKAIDDEDPPVQAEGDRELEVIWPQRLVLYERLVQELGPAWPVTLG